MNQQGRILVLLMACSLIAVGTLASAQEPNGTGSFKQEELDQMLAPIALFPDSLLAQMFMASTYPIEVVQAQRWVKDNNGLEGDALAAALEEKKWDPSVKSLVNFPEVLSMMSEKLDWTQKLGDAFLSQQKDVMDTVQKLRKKAQEQGNLKTNDKQTVKDDQQTISIESADSNGTYIPYYDPYAAYGAWGYPTYPPYLLWHHLREDGLRPTPYFGDRIGNGSAWGYAWGNCDWRGGNVGIDTAMNANLNSRINRDSYTRTGQLGQDGKGTWRHNPADRRGVPYRDQSTAQRYNRAPTAEAIQAREAYRGRTEQRRQQDLDRARANAVDNRQRAAQSSNINQRQAQERSDVSNNYSNRGAAFNDMSNGNAARNYSNRGQASRQAMPAQQPQMRAAPVQQPMRMPAGGGMRGGGRRR